ncbi:hypothetical protein [Rhizobium bangladeshense]|uniref:hypothetical protein n=1 Tax=Rhizobium bangladeshense TaxID=1138189 RepID=UPI0007E5A378|nr:hypothetical protein [Rhizobium bangladeshense]
MLNAMGGVYCEDCDVAALHTGDPSQPGVKPWAADTELAERLWRISEQMTGMALPCAKRSGEAAGARSCFHGETTGLLANGLVLQTKSQYPSYLLLCKKYSRMQIVAQRMLSMHIIQILCFEDIRRHI